MSSIRSQFRHGLAAAVFLVTLPAAVRAQSTSDSARTRDETERQERAVRRQRQGAGIRMGTWQMVGMTPVAGAEVSTMPNFEGYWQKGLDRHLALETSVGFWQRTQRTASGTGGESIRGYVVPMMTSLKVYPATGPEQNFEPFLLGGFGFTLGVDDRNTTSGGLFGGTGGSGMMMIPGVGVKLGGGVEYRLGSAFGFAASAGYQYVRFFQEVANAQTYKGVQVSGGLTYRFQF